jgi:hypothetical protein
MEEEIWKEDPLNAVLTHGKTIIVPEKFVTLNHIFENLREIWPMNRKQSKIVYYDHTDSEISSIKKMLSRIIHQFGEFNVINDAIDQCENNF